MPDFNATSPGLYLESQLTEYDPNLIKTEYPDAWTISGNNHQTKGDLPLGALKITASRLTELGGAGIYDGKAIDIPMVDFTLEGADFQALRFVAGTRYSEDEIESYKMAQKNGLSAVTDPVGAKMEAVQKMVYLKAHRTLLYGSKARGFRGWFTNNSLTLTAAVPAQKPLTMTNSQLYDWFSSILVEFAIKNALNPGQIFLFVDPRMMRKLNSLLENGTTMTVAGQLVGANTQGGIVKEVRSIYELTPEVLLAGSTDLPNALAANTGRIVVGAYQDASAAVRRYSTFQRSTPEKIPGTFEWVVLGSYSSSELMHRTPMKFALIDYNTALT